LSVVVAVDGLLMSGFQGLLFNCVTKQPDGDSFKRRFVQMVCTALLFWLSWSTTVR